MIPSKNRLRAKDLQATSEQCKGNTFSMSYYLPNISAQTHLSIELMPRFDGQSAFFDIVMKDESPLRQKMFENFDVIRGQLLKILWPEYWDLWNGECREVFLRVVELPQRVQFYRAVVPKWFPSQRVAYYLDQYMSAAANGAHVVSINEGGARHDAFATPYYGLVYVFSFERLSEYWTCPPEPPKSERENFEGPPACKFCDEDFSSISRLKKHLKRCTRAPELATSKILSQRRSKEYVSEVVLSTENGRPGYHVLRDCVLFSCFPRDQCCLMNIDTGSSRNEMFPEGSSENRFANHILEVMVCDPSPFGFEQDINFRAPTEQKIWKKQIRQNK